MTQSEQAHHPGIVKRLVGRVRSSTFPSPTPSPPTSSAQTSDSETPSKPRRRTTFRLTTPNTSKAHIPRSAPPVRPDAALSLDLWNSAYDNLRLSPRTSSLVTAYESIISQELPDHLKQGVNSNLSGDGSERRLELMEVIMKAGLMKRRGSNNSSADERVKGLLNDFKPLVEEVWEGYGSAPVAWAGVSTMTPLLLESILTKECIKRGVLHITGRIPYYMSLTLLLLPTTYAPSPPSDFPSLGATTIQPMILNLYTKILELEMNCICASASSWNNIAKHVVGWRGLDELVEEVEKMDGEVVEFIDANLEGEARERLLRRCGSMSLERGMGRGESLGSGSANGGGEEYTHARDGDTVHR